MAEDKAPPVPHPKDPFVLGSSMGFQRDILQTFVDGWREVGDVSWHRTPRPMYVLAHPDHVKHILDDHSEHHPRSGYVRGMLKNIMGEGLFTCDERLWRHQVGLVAPPFEPERVTPWAETMVEGTTELLGRLQSHAEGGGVVEVLPELVRSSLDVIGRILFGHDDWARRGETMREALIVSGEWAIPRVTGFPTPVERLAPAYRRYRSAMRTRDGIISEAIAARRDEPTDDLISTYVLARDEESGATLDDRGVLDAVTSAFFGVYKGPPIGLAWALYLLSLNPEARKRLEDEVDSVLAGRTPTVADLERLPYTSMVVHEALRLYPPLWLMSRPPDEEEVIGGYLVPERVYLLTVPYITHRHPDFWENPEEFDPERFTPEGSAGRHPCAYLPFGQAHRKCIGQAYSLLQIPLALAMIVQRFRLDIAPNYELGATTVFLLRPKDGLPMTLQTRRPSGQAVA